MKKQILRNSTYVDLDQYTHPAKQDHHGITRKREKAKLLSELRKFRNSGISPERLLQIEKYIRNAERGFLPMSHDGADVTRQITSEQMSKFLECEVCLSKPVVFVPCKKDYLAALPKLLKAKVKSCQVGICAKHWIDLSDTVIGWREQA